MSRLTWGALTERFFETGVDRGVLYVGVSAGVPWNGLVSVSESPTGGEPKPAYIDGHKFRNIASSEEFEATLEAFTAPKEFAPCDGSVSIQNGLIATQQPRRAFGLSYRTKVGNAVDGVDHAYKIHLVYNSLAAPAQRINTTLSDSQGLNALSWSLTTLPPSLTGYKPTAHWIIDSRTTPRGLLLAIENMLYGTSAAAARMPLVSELVTLFKSEGPIVRTNLCTNPNMEAAGALVTTRTNLIANPSAEIDAIGWGNLGWAVSRDITTFYTGAACFKVTSAAVAAIGTTCFSDYALGLVAGEICTMSMWVKSPTARTVGARIQWDNAAGTAAIGASDSASILLVPNVWTRISVTAACMAGSDKARAILLSDSTTIGDVVYFDAVLFEKSPTLNPYFDGSTAAGDFTYAWSGIANASTSLQKAPSVAGWSTAGIAHRDMTTFSKGAASVKVSTPTAIVGYVFQDTIAASAAPGDVWTLSADIKTAGTNGASWIIVIQAWNAVGGFLVQYQTALPFTVSTWTRFSVTTTALPAGTDRIRCFPVWNTTQVAGDIIFADAVLIEKSATAGPYFDGSTPDADKNFYSWAGVADASVSNLNSWN